MEEIDSVVFDLGGVLVDLDAERCIDAFRRRRLPNSSTPTTRRR